MRLKIIDNKDGTFSLYNQTDKKIIGQPTSYDKCVSIKKDIDKTRRDNAALKRGIR